MCVIRYASMRSLDISNGEGTGVSLFVQGCHFHCYNCFNKDTWGFNGGKEWTQEVEDEFIKLASRPYIKRISILGGEPLADENLDGVLNLINKIRHLLPTKTIWLYTGYKIKEIYDKNFILYPSASDMANSESDCVVVEESKKDKKRNDIIKLCDVVVDGRYVDELRDVSLYWRGSSNQRVIDTQQALQKGEIVLWAT